MFLGVFLCCTKSRVNLYQYKTLTFFLYSKKVVSLHQFPKIKERFTHFFPKIKEKVYFTIRLDEYE